MIVVTGATGNVGRALVKVLAWSGQTVTAISRAEAPVPEGVRHQRADLTEPDSLRPALSGARSLFLLVPARAQIWTPGAFSSWRSRPAWSTWCCCRHSRRDPARLGLAPAPTCA